MMHGTDTDTSMIRVQVQGYIILKKKKLIGVQFPPTPKTDWYLGIMIKSYHQE